MTPRAYSGALSGETGRDAALRWGSAPRPLATHETEGSNQPRTLLSTGRKSGVTSGLTPVGARSTVCPSWMIPQDPGGRPVSQLLHAGTYNCLEGPMADTEHIQGEPPILYYGTPVVLISSENEEGSINLAPMSSAFWLGWRCILGLATLSKTTQNPMRSGECVLNLPSVE